ncbi:MAG TPA: 1-acyl-sn-glycerol-3-phosphate acyltransferase [Tenuifilaceae bacterium]|nr:1-acyl-sn-glycerol-3-phosphate acyltransferase [Tenuifilaceae bacterium]HPN22521.1 1-acyl-sn-glycerol-3-phosphate acyltransferase [Tenuifilaceae bacterium]HPV56167.1 1-acyl-sn-glycerol-3-phosphate acyltransferase [Tenuifilaceae bacterium]
MAQNSNEIKYINVEKTIKESNSKLLNKLPGFIVKLIVKIIKQKEINRFLNKHSDSIGRDFLIKIIEEYNIKIEVEGKENLPENGKCIFVANHPFGLIDGLVLTHIVSGKYGSIKAIANDAFMLIPQLHPFIAAVNVFEGSSKEYLKALDETYYTEVPITHFPAGEVSRLYSGKVQDTKWQKSFITKSIASNRDIVPIYFYGRNSNLFYTIFLLRRLLGININLELILLPREFFNKRNKTLKVKIGKPIPYQTFDKSLTHCDWAQNVRKRLYSLSDKN